MRIIANLCLFIIFVMSAVYHIFDSVSIEIKEEQNKKASPSEE